jgi:hypothetical protein
LATISWSFGPEGESNSFLHEFNKIANPERKIATNEILKNLFINVYLKS